MSRRRGVAVLGSALAILLLAGGYLYLHGASTPVSVDAAVKQFRDAPKARVVNLSSAAATARGKPRPVTGPVARTLSAAPVASQTSKRAGRPLFAEGVYVYSTTGGDDVDVLGGSKHAYPHETTITARHTGCGLVERWDVLKERWDERESCPSAAGDELRRLTSYHEFFRHGDVRSFTCAGYTYPSGEAPSAAWSVRCGGSGTMTVTRLRAVAWEYVVVGGQRVRTLHVHASSTISGNQHGTSERDVWGSATSGLVIRERARVDSDSMQPVFGKTHYHEQYDIKLESLTPRR